MRERVVRLRPGRMPVALVAGVIGAACAGGPDGDGGPRSTVRDSAGVTIVENGRPLTEVAAGVAGRAGAGRDDRDGGGGAAHTNSSGSAARRGSRRAHRGRERG